MKIKTSELTGYALSWAVLECENGEGAAWYIDAKGRFMEEHGDVSAEFAPDVLWAQGGPLIERERIELIHYGSMGYEGAWEAQIGQDTHYIDQSPGDAMPGPTP